MKIFWYLFLFFSTNSIAQFSQNTKALKYSTKDGLSFGIVNSIVQDNNGFMWIATDDGLNRFDGISFRVFRHDSEEKFSLPGNYINTVFKDSHGQLWITSRKGLLKFDASQEHFYPQSLYNGKNMDEDISSISEAKNGNLWISSSLHGVFNFNPQTGKTLNYRMTNTTGMRSNTILVTLEDSQGLVWLGSHTNGISVFQQNNNKLRPYSVKNIELLNNYRINSIFEDSNHQIWLATFDGIYFFDRKSNNISKVGFANFSSNKVFLSLLEDKQKNLYIGVQDGGLYQIKIQPNYPQIAALPIQVVKEPNGVLTQRSVQCLYADKDQNIWLGTYGEGIMMLNHSPQRFLQFQKKITTQNTESWLRYYGMTADHEGNLWLGTDGDGIYKTTHEGKTLKHYVASKAKGSLTNNAILSAFNDSKNNLWFGSYAGGLYRYDPNTDSFINYKHIATDPNSIGANDVRVIFEDAQKNIWIGTNGGGFSRFNPQNQTFTNYSSKLRNFDSNDVRAIAQDHRGNLLIGTYGMGIIQFNPQTQKSTQLLKDVLPSGVVLSLAYHPNNGLWIGTQEIGLIRYQFDSNTYTRFTEKNGLSSNTILSIKALPNQQIWVSTNAGISKIDAKTNKIYNYDRKDGLQNGQFNGGSVLYEPRKGFLCFGGTEGWNLFYPKNIDVLTYQPNVLITGIQLYGKDIDQSGVPQREFIPFDNQNPDAKVELQPNQSVFSIQYGAINYSYPDESYFAYQLEGLDNDWNYAGKQKSATYRYLEPGHYVFKVKVANKDRVWSDKIASINVVILPPWYKTWWAYLIYLGIIASAIYYYQRYRQNQAELKYQIRVAKIEAEKEKELNEKKLSFFTQISHEFRTPLTLIINPIKELLKDESQDTNSLQLVYRNARRLLSLVDQLLLFRKAEAERDHLKVSLLNVKELAEEVFLCFTYQAKEKNLHYDFVCTDEQLEIYGDKEKLEIALFNLISNAIKFTPMDGAVSVSIEDTPRYVNFYIKDSGKGIDASVGEKLFEMFYQTKNTRAAGFGIGLFLTKTFIKYHKGDISYSSKEGTGTTFKISLPKGYDHLDIDSIVLESKPESALLDELKEEKIESKPLIKLNNQVIVEELVGEQNTMVVIDDNEQIRAYLKQIFQPQFKIYDAENGQQGLDLVNEVLPDIVICDIMMQGLNGIEVCTEIKQNKQLNHIPVILLTASTSSEVKLKGIEVGADDYISKPFEKDILIARINSILKSRMDLQQYFFNEVTLQAHNLKISPEYKQFLDQCITIVERNLMDSDFNVSVLATEIGMSSSSLYNRIKSICAQSPNNFIRFIRLRKAAEILISTDYTVSETAYQVGINDSKYFREQFNKQFGMNPSAYIKKYRKPFHNQHTFNKDVFPKKS
ncbi:hybrid sensor histidine kinase/response regulator transcription factor [Flectobacillus rivi]|uniref:histidine kinase n=1 Tax=Flectobacillus rivi TaxID=2984209 RepID=A0ABT6Z9K5_9BACT|nr:two-component regulator propeller domain-containing protein [Flectobacillus rivi]MDI9877286.1 two-component regulator propeller domain-containing protein [Flectobacillus rivi]